MIFKSISRNSLLLGVFAIATTGGIAATYLGTKHIIEEQKRAAEMEALLEIFPEHRHNNSLLDDAISVQDSEYLKLHDAKSLYIAKQDDKVVGFIIPAVAPEGYTDKLELIVGINRDGTIAGVRVLTHRETPGLGDKVDLKKSPWVLGFNGKSLLNPDVSRWKVKKDKGAFDQFTGATITPRAVTKAVLATLQYYDAHKDELMQKAQQLQQTQQGSPAQQPAAEDNHHG